MATGTRQPEKNEHGDDVKKPLFPAGGDEGSADSLNEKFYGPTADSQFDKIRGLQQQSELDNSGYDPDNPSSKAGSRGDIGSQEAAGGGSGASSAVSPAEKSLQADPAAMAEAKGKAKRDGLYSGKEKEGRFGGKAGSLRARITNTAKKRIAVVAVSGALAGGGIFGGQLLSGPFQYVHFAKQIGKHFKANEEFGNDRTSKILLYALASSGTQTQKGRLGITGNIAANKFEKRLLEKSGMRPVYQQGTGRFIGFEIVDDNKAREVLGDVGDQDTRASRRVEQSMGPGADIRTAGEARDGNNTTLLRPDGSALPNDQRLVDLTEVGAADRRAWIKTINRANGTHFISSTIGSRILIKRGGVNFHPLNKVKGKIDAAIEKRIIDRRNNSITQGVQSVNGITPENDAVDDNGDPVEPTQETIDASDDTKSFIDDFKNSGALKTTTNAAVIIGVLCAAKQYGEGIEDYKYQNNVLPMMRLGFNSMASGYQVMSGSDVDIGTLGVLVKYMYDKENGTSWQHAESIRAEQGKTGGTPIAPEADLRDAGDKPRLFDALDSIPALGTACGAINGFFGLPIIKEVSGAISELTTGVIDRGLKLAGQPSSAELLESSMKAVAGKSVDTLSKGAAFGNLANTGTFLAANDQATSMGGRDLSQAEWDNLDGAQMVYDEQDRQEQPFIARYFDPYESTSVVGSMIDAAPLTPSHAASMVMKPVNNIGASFAGLFSSFMPTVKADAPYDYGTPKRGFSLQEQRDPLYENPYENGMRDILEADLPTLNRDFGEKCLGMTVTADDSGVHIETTAAVNVFKLKKENPECNEKAKNDPRIQQYRMYIADANTALALACWEGDAASCPKTGAADPGSADPTSDNGTNGTGASAGEANIIKIANPLPGSNCNCEIDPKGVTLHWWGSEIGQGIDGLTNIFSSNNLSVQLGITSDGKVYQLTEKLTTKTSHAIGGNSSTIGIEIEGGPGEFGREGIEKYPEKFEAVVATVQFLKDKYNLPLQKKVGCDNGGSPPSGILQHSDFNSCPDAVEKSDIDDYYYNEVMKRVK